MLCLGKILELVKGPASACLQPSSLRGQLEESALLEREAQNTTELEATCADGASDGNIPCAVRDKQRPLISLQNASCHNSRLRQDCRPACTCYPANSGLQHRCSLRSGTAHGAAACRAFQNFGRFLQRPGDVEGRFTRCCSHHHAATEPLHTGERMSRSGMSRLSGETFYGHR